MASRAVVTGVWVASASTRSSSGGHSSVAGAWGYCGPVEPTAWGADHLLATPADLLALIRSTVPSPTPLAA